MPFSYDQEQYIDVSDASEQDRVNVVLDDGQIIVFYKDACDTPRPDFLRLDLKRTSPTILDQLYISIQEYERDEIRLTSSWLTRRWRIKHRLPSLRWIEFNSVLGAWVWDDEPVIGDHLTIEARVVDDDDPGNWWSSSSPIRSIEFATLLSEAS
jgi:hypothetical protein